MTKYTINYHTGVSEEVEVMDLQEAKELAYNGISYTQENVSIEQDGEVITTAYWYGVVPSEDDEVLVEIGGGHYQTWSDELE